jgi:hypothetical protein
MPPGPAGTTSERTPAPFTARPGSAQTTISIQQSPGSAYPANRPHASCPTSPAGTDQPGITAGTARLPWRTGRTGAAVSVQDSAITTGLSRGRRVSAVAD